MIASKPSMPSTFRSRAATIIQTHWRGKSIKDRFSIKQLPQSQQTSYLASLRGNDPIIRDLPVCSSKDQMVLIGTSGFRSIEFACKLSKGFVKLIIIDNSKNVVCLWRQARKLIESAKNEAEFKKQFIFFYLNQK